MFVILSKLGSREGFFNKHFVGGVKYMGNNKLKYLLISLLCCVVSVNIAYSQTQISIESLVEEGLKANRDLQAVGFIVKQAEARLLQAGLIPNPELEGSRTTDRTFNNEGEFSGSIGFVQKFPVAGRISRAKELSRVDVKLAEAEFKNAKRLFIGEISNIAKNLYVLQERDSSIAKLKDAFGQLIKVSESRFKNAEVPVTDLNTMKLELAKLNALAVTVDVEKVKNKEELRRLIGGSLLQTFNIASPKEVSLPQDSGTLVSEATKRRPDWEFAALNIDRTKAEEALARAEKWEDWSIGIGYSRDESVFTQQIGDQRDDFIGLKLSVPLPIWNQNEGKIAEAKASQKRKTYELEALEFKIRQEIISSFEEINRLKPTIDDYKSRSIPLAEQNLLLLRKGYEQGLSPSTSLIQAQQQLLDLRNNYLASLGTYLKAQTEFELAIGGSKQLLEIEGTK